MTTKTMQVHCITNSETGRRYIWDEDVAALIREVAAGEPTDTRNCMEELADNILETN